MGWCWLFFVVSLVLVVVMLLGGGGGGPGCRGGGVGGGYTSSADPHGRWDATEAGVFPNPTDTPGPRPRWPPSRRMRGVPTFGPLLVFLPSYCCSGCDCSCRCGQVVVGFSAFV